MRPWSFPIHLDLASAEPIYLQIARAISGDIRRGRLRPGNALPGSRTLAQTLGVHRNTVLAALQELHAEGWIQTLHRTTRVAGDLPPAPIPSRTLAPGGMGFPLPTAAVSIPADNPGGPGMLSFDGGLPDLRLLPKELIGRAYGRALRNRDLLGYGDPKGEIHLRSALAGMLSEARGLSIDPGRLMTAGGSQMVIDLVARTLIRPGDRVAVEDPGYPAAWATLRAAGAELVPVPVDEGGLCVESLSALLEKKPLRALYCTPHHQFPTTATMQIARRLRLLELARDHRMAILEDDYDYEFHFDVSPILPLASMDRSGVVVYMGTLSKVLAPGLRLGFLTGPQPLVDAVASFRYISDRQGDQVMERAVGDLLEEGLIQRHVRKMRKVYHARRGILAGILGHHLKDVVSWELPPGGMSLWLTAEPSVDVEAWARRAERRGVQLSVGRRYDFRGLYRPNLRVGFTALDEDQMEEAVLRMKAAL